MEVRRARGKKKVYLWGMGTKPTVGIPLARWQVRLGGSAQAEDFSAWPRGAESKQDAEKALTCHLGTTRTASNPLKRGQRAPVEPRKGPSF